ncbi:MAG: hypothetical protein KIT09_02185 [Bryobacteraceae bacterium]|nr:hypothetical protein [Bryobacteraceae bacterium]
MAPPRTVYFLRNRLEQLEPAPQPAPEKPLTPEQVRAMCRVWRLYITHPAELVEVTRAELGPGASEADVLAEAGAALAMARATIADSGDEADLAEIALMLSELDAKQARARRRLIRALDLARSRGRKERNETEWDAFDAFQNSRSAANRRYSRYSPLAT